MKDTVGIVTVLYNSDAVLPDFFASLARQQDVALKLYVIDNSPTPSGLEICRALAAELDIEAELVFNNHNCGVAKGNNQGIELALRDGCRWVLLSNNDVDFAAGTIGMLLEPARAGETAVTPKILYHGPGQLVWYAGGKIDPWRMLTSHTGMRCVDNGQFETAAFTNYAPTCFMLLDSSVFARVGLMDERYFVYYDDSDFVWRMNHAGLRIRYVPQAVVHHKVSTSTGGDRSPFTLYYTSRNRIFFIRKNLRGLQRAVALAYVLTTRAINAARLPQPLAGRIWAGMMDGIRLPIKSNGA
jgi:GT2 family glycosyltransferase